MTEIKSRLCRVAFATTVLISATATVASAADSAATATAPITVQLNKLDPHDKGCSAYIVVNNPTSDAYSAFKLDLILFRPDGVIDRRLALDLAPLRANKTSVKTFDLDNSSCDSIGSVLVNDVIDCQIDAKAVADCLDRMTASSKAAASFGK